MQFVDDGFKIVMTIPTERIVLFLSELAEITKKHGIAIRGNGVETANLYEPISSQGRYIHDDAWLFEQSFFWRVDYCDEEADPIPHPGSDDEYEPPDT